jgi:hypothetical protein
MPYQKNSSPGMKNFLNEPLFNPKIRSHEKLCEENEPRG